MRCEDPAGREVRRARVPVAEVRRIRRVSEPEAVVEEEGALGGRGNNVAVAGKCGVWKGAVVGIKRVPEREEGSVLFVRRDGEEEREGGRGHEEERWKRSRGWQPIPNGTC